MEYIIVLVLALIIVAIANIIIRLGNLILIIRIWVRNTKMKIESQYIDLVSMNREIDVEYSPAVLSYIYNFKLEPKKDILATILNLYNKKILKIKNKYNKYIFSPELNVNLENLTPDEKYIYETLIKLDKRKKFSAEEWKNIVIDEYNKKFDIYIKHIEMTEEKMYKVCILPTIILTIIWGRSILQAIGLDFYEPPTNWFAAIGLTIIVGIVLFIPVLMVVGIIDCQLLPRFKFFFRRLKKEEQDEIKKWIKFKRFMKDYTLIDERKIEEVVLYEKYIPYAMALNINKEYNNEEIKYFIKYFMKNVSKNIDKYMNKIDVKKI